MAKALPLYSELEDQLNVQSHTVGSILSVLGAFLLIGLAAGHHSPWALPSAVIYGASLITMFSASSLYHGLKHPVLRALMQRFDHIAILYLIAGTFTPFALVALQEPTGWWVFGFVWLCAIAGTVVHFSSLRKYHLMMVTLNLVMGWSALLLIGPLAKALSPVGLGMLVAGGLTYTLGLVFYLNDRIFLNHFIWHLFVLAGAMIHFLTVALFVYA